MYFDGSVRRGLCYLNINLCWQDRLDLEIAVESKSVAAVLLFSSRGEQLAIKHALLS